MKNLIATKSLSYGGKRYAEGEEFSARSQHARVLEAIGKAKIAPEPVEAKDVKPAEVEPVEAKDKRGYKRRDMRAQ